MTWKRSTIILAIAMLTFAAGPANAEKRLAIGATVAASQFYGYFVTVSQLINKNVKGVTATVMETGATVDNLKRMKRGQLDLGLVTTNTLHQAYYGKAKFKGNAIKSKLLWIYSLAPQVTLVRKDSGVKSLKELNGKKFCAGMRGSSTEQTTMDVFKLFGIKPEYFKGSVSDYVTAIKDDRIIGYTASMMGNSFTSTMIDVASFTPVSILGVNQEQAASILKNLPELTIYDVPANKVIGNSALRSWAFALGASAAENMDKEMAYQIVKTVMENKDKQAGAMPAINSVDFAKATIQMASSPLHPGAIKYLREKGYKIPANLIAPEDR